MDIMKKFVLNVLVLFALLTAIFVKADAFSFNEMTLRFAQVSDVHLSDRPQDTSYKALTSSAPLLRDAIKQINFQNNLDFVVFTGDNVDMPNDSDYMNFFKLANAIKFPYYTVLGNHDISQDGGEITKEKYILYSNSHNKNFKFDKAYYTFNPKPDYKVIVLDMSVDNEITANGFIDEEQLKWLDEELSKSKNKVVIIFQHFPAIEPFASEHHRLKNAQEYLDVVQKYTMPIAIFSGHYHTTKITREDNILHISTPSLVTYPNSFRFVSITNYKDRTIFDFYYKETGLKDVQERSKVMAMAASSFYGTDKDRNTTFVIDKKDKNNKKNKKNK